MASRPTLSTNLPASGGRKVRAAIREATKAAASTHAVRHLPWHFEAFAFAKYGYTKRSDEYKKLRERLVRYGLLAADDLNRPLVFKKDLIKSVLKNWRVTATGTEGASLILKGQFMSGRALDPVAIKRMLADTKRDDSPKLRRLLIRLIKSRGELTKNQIEATKRVAELKAIAKDELKYLTRIEEEFFSMMLNKPEPLRTL